MNRFRNLMFALLLSTLLLIVLPVLAQDTTPVPTDEPVATAEPVPVDTVVTTTTTTTAPIDAIGLTINWALALLLLLQMHGLAYAISVEKTIKPALYYFVPENTPLRNGLLITAVFIGAVVGIYAGGINFFADAPFGLLNDASPLFLLVLNSLFMAAATFVGAEEWATLESWLKKLKAITEIFSSQSYIAQQTPARPSPDNQVTLNPK